MKVLQLAKVGLQPLWCHCQIIAGSAKMNFHLSDTALIAWLKGGIWLSGWQSQLPGSYLEKNSLGCSPFILLYFVLVSVSSPSQNLLNALIWSTPRWPPPFNLAQGATSISQFPNVLSGSWRVYFNFSFSFWSARDRPPDWSKTKRSRAPRTDLVKCSHHQCGENASAGAVIHRVCG